MLQPKKKMAVIPKGFMNNQQSDDKKVYNNRALMGFIEKESKNKAIDKAELNRTGQIASPKSEFNKRIASGIQNRQTNVSKETRSQEEMDRVKRAVVAAKSNSKHEAKPLIYLDNPDKLLGDAFGAVAPNNKFGFPTSKKEREELAYNTHNPYKSQKDKLDFSFKKGLEHIPGAAANLLLAGEGAGASGILKTLNNAVNPLAGSGTTLIRLKDAAKRTIGGRMTKAAAIHELKRTGAATVSGIVKDESKEEALDVVEKKSGSLRSTLNILADTYNPMGLRSKKSGEDFMKKWYNNDETKRRANSFNTGQQAKDWPYNFARKEPGTEKINFANREFKDYIDKDYGDLLKDKGAKKALPLFARSSGVSYAKPDEIYVKSQPHFGFSKERRESTKVHELTHLAEANGGTFNDLEKDALLSPFGYNTKTLYETGKSPLRVLGSRDKEYFVDPTEIHARMNEARFKLNKTPEQEFTGKDFNKIQLENNWFGMGKHIKDPKAFVKLMNNFYTQAGVVGTGALKAVNTNNKDSKKQ